MPFSEYLLEPWVYGPLASLALVLVLLVAKRVIFALLHRLTARTSTEIDDIFFGAANRPLNLLIIASGLYLLVRILPLADEADRGVLLLYNFFIIGAMVWFLDRLSRGLLKHYAARIVFLDQAKGIIQGLVRGLFVGLGILILLDSMGISITPLIASLGVGSLAVALALQGTLENMFAGVHMLADKAVQPGQFIRLESGDEGWVEHIGWRSTRVRMLTNVMLVVPNSKLVESIITNYGLPEEATNVRVPVGVHYDSDLRQVERVTLDIARQIQREVEGGVPDFEPRLRYKEFGDSSINFVVILQAKAYTEHFPMLHEFVMRLHERYRQEGIVIPFPMRTLDIPGPILERLAPRRAG